MESSFEAFVLLLAFIFGLLIGSFLNMLIYRLSNNIKLFSPNRSFCPSCKKKIFWYENIPLMSFIFLKGKCSGCQSKISWQYPIVEFVVGLASLFILSSTEFMLGEYIVEHIAKYFFKLTVFSLLLVHFIIDFRHKILPNVLNLYLGIIFLFHSLLYHSWEYWLVGGIIGVLFPSLVTWAFYLVRGKVGLGMGDIKLFGALGVYLGPLGILQNIFLSCFLGSILGLSLILAKKMDRNDTLAFGPYIIVVAVFQIFLPQEFHRLMKIVSPSAFWP